jgi:hypothetical protein
MVSLSPTISTIEVGVVVKRRKTFHVAPPIVHDALSAVIASVSGGRSSGTDVKSARRSLTNVDLPEAIGPATTLSPG